MRKLAHVEMGDLGPLKELAPASTYQFPGVVRGYDNGDPHMPTLWVG